MEGWATPMKTRARGAADATPDASSLAQLASPASAFAFPTSAQQQKFRPRPLFPAAGAGARGGATQATLPASLPVVRRAGPPRRVATCGVDLCALAGEEGASPRRGSSPARSGEPRLDCGAAPAPWSELYVLPYRRGSASPGSSSEPSEGTPAPPSTVSSPASARGGSVDVSPLARLLRGGSAAGAGASPVHAASPAAGGAGAAAAASPEACTPRGKRKRAEGGSPPARPARLRLSELLMRHHREAALRADPV